MMFQMTFAIITPALIAGAFADRMKFSAMCVFMVLWSLLVYSPVAHWVWAPTGWLDAAGRAGLRRRHRGAYQRRRRRADVRAGARQAASATAATTWRRTTWRYAVIGASLLWVGWFGFNAGSAVAPTAVPAWRWR